MWNIFLQRITEHLWKRKIHSWNTSCNLAHPFLLQLLLFIFIVLCYASCDNPAKSSVSVVLELLFTKIIVHKVFKIIKHFEVNTMIQFSQFSHNHCSTIEWCIDLRTKFSAIDSDWTVAGEWRGAMVSSRPWWVAMVWAMVNGVLGVCRDDIWLRRDPPWTA